METITRTTIPASAYPRYRYAGKYVKPFIKRCQKLLQKCGIRDDFSLPKFESVILNIQAPQDTILIHNEQLVVTKPAISQVSKEYLTVAEYVEEVLASSSDTSVKDPVIFIASHTSARREGNIPGHYRKFIVLISEEETPQQFSCADNEYICVTSRAKFSDTISCLLERIVFRFLEERLNVLNVFRNIGHDVELEAASSWSKQKYISALYNAASDLGRFLNPEKSPIEDVPVSAKSFYKRRSSNKLELGELQKNHFNCGRPDMSEEEVFTTHVELARANLQKIRETISEGVSMYGRSKVPDLERPQVGTKPRQVTDEMARAVFDNVHNAVGCGYRLGSFNIFVKETEIEQYSEETIQDIRSVLKPYGITDFILRSDPKEVMMFSGCKVGSAISAMGVGTLGGFARKGNETCALIAKHVAGEVTHLSLIDERNNDEIVIGTILTPSVDTPLVDLPVDIAAATLNNVTTDTLFKNSDKEPMQSRLFDFISGDIDFLEGLHVYIWGAKTNPGSGKITMAEFIRNTFTKCIAIEDLDPDEVDGDENPQHFAKEGDSGSIVCADDMDGQCVHVISMLMGLKLNRATEKSIPRQYMSFYLQQGLTQLQHEHGEPFQLC
ncbi:uncharacterized protein LOC128207015 [Mya arenaria]|uniref:uncharacterized protein LOC128207015 n=1 Tax=Mya arenaria TaxID=6604 RepID=UPI0022E3507E|nr:uncharacterized protein LOC128207015 [Mya arenaria]